MIMCMHFNNLNKYMFNNVKVRGQSTTSKYICHYCQHNCILRRLHFGRNNEKQHQIKLNQKHYHSDNGSLTNDKKRICKLLLEQFNSAFSIPLSEKVVTDPVSFFAVSNACYKKSEVLLTSINFSEQNI